MKINSSHSLYTYFILLLTLVMFSCEPPAKTSYETGIRLRVEVPMGQIDPAADVKELRLPYLGNKAQIPNLDDDELEFLILSETFSKNEFVQTYPIAVLRLDVQGKSKSIVIAIPSDGKNESIRINNFIEFVSEYYFLKQNVENWYLNKHGMGNSTLISWEDEKYALNLINRKLRNKG